MNSASLKPLQMIGVSLSAMRHDGQQFRLRPGLEAELVRAAEVEHFLDDLSLLIDLDRIDAAVAALVLVLADGALKRRVDVGEPLLDDVGEADEHRQADAAELQPVDEFLEVDRLADVLGRMHLDVAGRVDREVAVAPARHFVELAGVVHAPRRRGRRAGIDGPSVGQSAH